MSNRRSRPFPTQNRSESNQKSCRSEKLKEETALLNTKRQLVNDAESIPELPIFREYDRNGISCTVTIHTSCLLEYRDWIFGITARDMEQYYETS
jgi:hypothetical protein